ncbi:MAG: hypothetical protein E6J71_27110 [Deltaproteobacteria bacterium]|nr:MAG: hypothetical protein E6J71_27110 [Deltaproteobacteria bacterium]
MPIPFTLILARPSFSATLRRPSGVPASFAYLNPFLVIAQHGFVPHVPPAGAFADSASVGVPPLSS